MKRERSRRPSAGVPADRAQALAPAASGVRAAGRRPSCSGPGSRRSPTGSTIARRGALRRHPGFPAPGRRRATRGAVVGCGLWGQARARASPGGFTSTRGSRPSDVTFRSGWWRNWGRRTLVITNASGRHRSGLRRRRPDAHPRPDLAGGRAAGAAGPGTFRMADAYTPQPASWPARSRRGATRRSASQ